MSTHQHHLRVYPSAEPLPREEQLAWKLAELATTPHQLLPEVEQMIGNRIIDNAAVAIAAINRLPVQNARSQALAHPREKGAVLFGLTQQVQVDAEWAAWANGTAVRELDMHDTFLAADYSHPADSIPPLLAVAQQMRCSGEDLVRGINVAYEVHISLVKGICLHKHKKDHIAHLCPAQAAGIAAMLGLSTEVTYQAIQQAVHVSFTTRQSRKGEISSWKAYAPAHAGKLAIEAVDRAMRGEKSPSPIYEGEDSVIAYMLDGPDATYDIPLATPGSAYASILESYTKEHSAEYQSQALIDLAFRLREKIDSTESIESICIKTSHHTHYVIGTGSNDPQKFDPKASRETLDHSIMYIFAVALEDGNWHHVQSYTPERAQREATVRLWRAIRTEEDPLWTQRYHASDPNKKAFGGSVIIQMKDGTTLEDELLVANAHPNGARPFARNEYMQKLETLTEGLIDAQERSRFYSLVDSLRGLSSEDILALSLSLSDEKLEANTRDTRGIF